MPRKNHISLIMVVLIVIGFGGCDRRILGMFFHGVERRTAYITTEDSNIEIPNIIQIIPSITEGGVYFSQKFLTIYMDYNVPHKFELDFIFLGDKKQVDKIVFNYAKFIVNDEEYDIKISEEEVCTIFHSWYYENTGNPSFQRNDPEIKLSFQRSKQLIIYESDNIVVKEYYIGVGELYLDYESINNISVEYNITVELRNGENIPINDTIIFSRIYEEIIER
jgi:hypothetical protein